MRRDFIPASAICLLLSLKQLSHHYPEVDYPLCPVKWVHSTCSVITIRTFAYVVGSACGNTANSLRYSNREMHVQPPLMRTGKGSSRDNVPLVSFHCTMLKVTWYVAHRLFFSPGIRSG